MTETEAVLRDIEQIARVDFLPIIGPVKGKYLVDTVRRFKVKTALEVGTLIGYSAILIASNLPEGGKLHTIEISPCSARLAGGNISRAGLDSKVEIHTGDAIKVIPQISEDFDMVFLDATKNEYLDYLRLAEDKLKKGGVVFADNVKIFAGAMQDFLDYVRNSGKYKSEFIDVGSDGIERSIKQF